MMDYTIVYEDNEILLIDKPQGLPTATGRQTSLCDLLFKEYPKLSTVNGYNKNDGGLLNRLDNDTGGIVFFAKNNDSFLQYSSLMKSNKVKKIYTAMVENIPKTKEGVINYTIAHHYKKKGLMVICEKSQKYRGKQQSAITKWTMVKQIGNNAVLEMQISKGVRHQIRLHLATEGFPIIGDKLYNKKSQIVTQYHLLYATGIVFYSFEKQKELKIFINPNFKDKIDNYLEVL